MGLALASRGKSRLIERKYNPSIGGDCENLGSVATDFLNFGERSAGVALFQIRVASPSSLWTRPTCVELAETNSLPSAVAV